MVIDELDSARFARSVMGYDVSSSTIKY